VHAAVSASAVHQGEAQPVLLRAPEVILGHPWSQPVDIWSVGCLVGHITLPSVGRTAHVPRYSNTWPAPPYFNCMSHPLSRSRTHIYNEFSSTLDLSRQVFLLRAAIEPSTLMNAVFVDRRGSALVEFSLSTAWCFYFRLTFARAEAGSSQH
jgi:hypothetical protein